MPPGAGGISDVSCSSVGMKDWGGFQFAESVFADILEERNGAPETGNGCTRTGMRTAPPRRSGTGPGAPKGTAPARRRPSRQRQRSFGTVAMGSDVDLLAETACKAYEDRRETGSVMRYYKSACEFDETPVRDDHSEIGSESSDFLATVLTFRLIKSFDRAGLLEKMTYSKVMNVLKRAKKTRHPREDRKLVRLNPGQEEMLRKLMPLPGYEASPTRRRGRPRKINV